MTSIKNTEPKDAVDAYKKWWMERMEERKNKTDIPALPDFYETFLAGWKAKGEK